MFRRPRHCSRQAPSANEPPTKYPLVTTERRTLDRKTLERKLTGYRVSASQLEELLQAWGKEVLRDALSVGQFGSGFPIIGKHSRQRFTRHDGIFFWLSIPLNWPCCCYALNRIWEIRTAKPAGLVCNLTLSSREQWGTARKEMEVQTCSLSTSSHSANPPPRGGLMILPRNE